jgi:SOS-response transcriptional repressor LexA
LSEGAIAIPESFIPRAGMFICTVSGDSMTGDGIRDGDALLIDPHEPVEPGDIAAVRVSTPRGIVGVVRHVWYRGPDVILIAGNPAFTPVIVSAEETEIAGRVVAVYHAC